MSSASDTPPAPPSAAATDTKSPGGKKRRGALIPTLIVIALIVAFVFAASRIWTEVLWFDQLGYLNVFTTEVFTKVGLFIAAGAIFGALVWLALFLAYRSRPIYPPVTAKQQNLDRYRQSIEPLRRLLMWAVPIIVGLFAGSAAASQWTTFQLWINQESFGQVDPQFGLDIGFYVFTLPWLQFLVGFFKGAVIVALIGSVLTHYLYGAIKLPGSGGGSREWLTKPARLQLFIMAAVLMLLFGFGYWLDRYQSLTSEGSKFSGADYTDVHAVIPSKEIMVGVAVVVAVLFIVAAVRGSGTWRLPTIGISLMLVSAIVVGGVYPALIQKFQVEPNQQELEAEYIQRNINATREAYGLTDVDTQTYTAKTEAEQGALRADADTTASIRLLDPAVVSPSFRQLQQNKQYYNFPDTLSVDRYDIEGTLKDTVIAVRELNLAGLATAQRSWVNDHTVYTHGYGVVAAYGNTVASDGRPAFYQQGIPSTGKLGEYEPRIYFGQNSPEYSIVGAPEGSKPWELDYPDDAEETGQKNTTFTGNGGPKVDNIWTQLLYALRFGSEQILFSDRVNSESQILYDRDPRERVQKVAPYLTLDGRVYPAVVDEKVVWIVDGYTTSNAYPYSEPESLEQATTDSLTARSSTVTALQPAKVNYIRNSVKAVVNAYDGSVTLYSWDDKDPVLKAWSKVFPSNIEPMSKISGDLMSHLRYPEDLFKVQRQLLTNYHVSDAASFYSGQDFWRLPNDPTQTQSQLQPPFYLTLEMPGSEQPSFSLMSTFIPGGNTDRNVLTGFLAVNAEPGSKAGQRADDYGKLTLLQLPRDLTVPGPGQVQNNLESTTEVSSYLNLLRQGKTQVIYGNLLTLPMGGGLLYVEPVYVQSSSGTQFPLLQKVLVAFGDQVGFADTLDEALDQVFEGDSGASAGDAGTERNPVEPEDSEGSATPTPTGTATATPQPTATGGTDGAAQNKLDTALQDAKKAMEDSGVAMEKGDWAAYGKAQERLGKAIEDALAAEKQLKGGG